jgi:hypothetical protein
VREDLVLRQRLHVFLGADLEHPLADFLKPPRS